MLEKKYVEPTMWEDLTTEEKIERMREEIKKTLNYQFQTLSGIARRLGALEEHGHLEGKIVSPINRGFGSGTCSGEQMAKRADGKSYF